MNKMGLLGAGNMGEVKKMQEYLKQVKEECGNRLLDRIYDHNGMDLKYWLAFGRRPFMGHKFNNQP